MLLAEAGSHQRPGSRCWRESVFCVPDEAWLSSVHLAGWKVTFPLLTPCPPLPASRAPLWGTQTRSASRLACRRPGGLRAPLASTAPWLPDNQPVCRWSSPWWSHLKMLPPLTRLQTELPHRRRGKGGNASARGRPAGLRQRGCLVLAPVLQRDPPTGPEEVAIFRLPGAPGPARGDVSVPLATPASSRPDPSTVPVGGARVLFSASSSAGCFCGSG